MRSIFGMRFQASLLGTNRTNPCFSGCVSNSFNLHWTRNAIPMKPRAPGPALAPDFPAKFDLNSSIVKTAALQNRVRRAIRCIRQRVHAKRQLPVIVSGLSLNIVQLQLVKELFPGHLASIGRAARESQMASWLVGHVCMNFFVGISLLHCCYSRRQVRTDVLLWGSNEAGFSHSALNSG
jgi:hypothetical protein